VSETFLSSYLKHTSIYESPTAFWKWSAYVTIAATLRDSCYLPQGDGRLYPNIFVLLLAESGGHRKGKPVELSETLINKIGRIKVISGRASAQAVLDELGRSETDKDTGKIQKSSAAIMYAPELSAGIVNDPDGLKILTDIYDFKLNPYRNRLRTGPCFNLDKIVFNMFTASNEAMLKDFFNYATIKGGYLARTFLILPDEFRESNALMDIDEPALKQSFANVLSKLLQVGELHGEFRIETDAKEEYKNWYGPFRKSYATMREETGVVGRIHTSALKLALILAANNCRLNVQKQDVEEAINECVSLLRNYSVFTMSNSKTEQSQMGGLIITELLSAPTHQMDRKDIIRNLWQQGLDVETLDKISITLEQAGLIKQIVTGNKMVLSLTPSCLAQLNGAAVKGPPK
jgi:hypothetical protein